MKKVTIEKYQTDDGQMFDTSEEALEYEQYNTIQS